jgi:hypothetical protein
MNDLSARKPVVEKEIITKASASLFCDQIEKTVHPLYKIREALGRGQVLRRQTMLFCHGRLGPRAHS